MGPRRWVRRGATTVVLGGVLLALLATPAPAEIDGPCQASGDFFVSGVADGVPDVSVDAAASGSHEIPAAAVVAWNGSISGVGSEPRDYVGAVFIDTPADDFFEFFSIPLEFDTWDGVDETGSSSSGIESYDVANDYLPGGAQIVVSGFHDDAGASCDGSVTLHLAGSPWDSVTTQASAAGGVLLLLLALGLALRGKATPGPLGVLGTALYGAVVGLLVGLLVLGSAMALLIGLLGLLAGAGAAVASRRGGRDVVAGHPTPGWVLGLLAGLLLGVLGWALGVYPLSSAMLLVVPLVTTVLGFLAGLWGPLGGGSGATVVR